MVFDPSESNLVFNLANIYNPFISNTSSACNNLIILLYYFISVFIILKRFFLYYHVKLCNGNSLIWSEAKADTQSFQTMNVVQQSRWLSSVNVGKCYMQTTYVAVFSNISRKLGNAIVIPSCQDLRETQTL